jgi:DNA replication initiation complex subunit (GINS family)
LITYESVKEAWIREILTEELQSLSPDFLEDLRRAIDEVERRIAESEGSEPLRSLLQGEGERLKVFYDQIIQERLSKLLLAASLGEPPRFISDDEKKLFEEAKSLSDPYKERFYRILEDETPNLPPVEAMPEPITVQTAGAGPGTERSSEPERREKSPPRTDRNEMLRVLADFPRFVGPDLRNYGPFEREDIVALPDEVSGILLSRRVGERIRPSGEVHEDAEKA